MAASGTDFHVLLVEDDDICLKCVEQLLKKCGYRVSSARGGAEALRFLESAKEKGERVDLVLTDICMPEVTGFDLINEVVHGERFSDVPVVVMSSQDSQESVLQAFQAGACDYLIKPIRKNELATLWQHVWRANKARGTGASAHAGGGAAGHSGRDSDGALANGGREGEGRGHHHEGHHHHESHHHHEGGHIKDSSGGSTGAATSVLHSTGGTTLPTRGASNRHPSATGAPSGPSAVNHAHGHTSARTQASSEPEQGQPTAAAHGQGRAAASPLGAQDSSAQGVLRSSGTGLTQQASGPVASVAVHFDLNPLSLPHANGHGAANGHTVGGSAGAARAAVIPWSRESLPEGEPAEDEGGAEEAHPRKRLRGDPAGTSTGPNGTTCTGTRHALPLGRLAAEGSQGSRAASASAATGTGTGNGTREGTTTPSADTFAESPSTFTSATNGTTGSGSEADEKEPPGQGSQGRGQHGGPSGTCSEPAAGRPHSSGLGDTRRSGSSGHNSAAAPSAEPMPHAAAAAPSAAPSAAPAVDAAAAADTAHHGGLSHPSAAAPSNGPTHGLAVALPPGLQELAVLGAQRHQELWTQRNKAHQERLAAAAAAAAVAAQQQPQGPRAAAQASAAAAAAEQRDGASPRSAVASAAAPVPATQQAAAAATAAAPSAQGPAAPSSTAVAAASPACASSAAGAVADAGTNAQANGNGNGSMSLLRHSDRSAFTAFTVFLPGRVAAAAAAAAAASAAAGNSSAAPAAVAAAAAAAAAAAVVPLPGYGPPRPPTLLPPPPPLYGAAGAAAPHPPPPGCVLPPVLPLHPGAPPPMPCGPKPPDQTVATAALLGPALMPPGAAAAAAAAAVAAHMPFPGMPPRAGPPPPTLPPPYGPVPPHPTAAAAAAAAGSPPLYIPESVLQLIAHLSGRAAAEIPVPDTVTTAPVAVARSNSAARLAAVAKYLEKRKHRNFQKKVRYESRKRLAEARPRVRGQFVKASTAPAPSPTPPPPATAATTAPKGANTTGSAEGANGGSTSAEVASVSAPGGQISGVSNESAGGATAMAVDQPSNGDVEVEDAEVGDGEESDESAAEP